MPARDVFICHAGANKRTHAYPLVEELGLRSVSCWLDEAQIEPGDSIVEAINEGLRLATYVVVIVTDEVLEGKWPMRELSSALSREIRTGETLVIPVLAVPHETWADRVPLAEDKLHLAWESGVASVADAIASRFDRVTAAEWAHRHPSTWTGPVWVRLNPVAAGPHTLVARWGPYLRKISLAPKTTAPWSMVHHKTASGDITLHVSVEPDATITFGQGPPPDAAPRATNIDEGWVRASGVPIEEAAAASGIPLPRDRRALADLLSPEDEAPSGPVPG